MLIWEFGKVLTCGLRDGGAVIFNKSKVVNILPCGCLKMIITLVTCVNSSHVRTLTYMMCVLTLNLLINNVSKSCEFLFIFKYFYTKKTDGQ